MKNDVDDSDVENLRLELIVNKKLFEPTFPPLDEFRTPQVFQAVLDIAPEYKIFDGSGKSVDPELLIDILMKRNIFPENISVAHTIAFIMFASERLSFYFETICDAVAGSGSFLDEKKGSMQMQYYEECFFKYCQFLKLKDSRPEVNEIIQKERSF